jgi:hypothetical protein
VASITGTNFSSWYNQTEGTLFVETVPAPLTSSFSRVAAIENASFASAISIQRNGTDARGFGPSVSTIVSSGMPQGSLSRIALAGQVNSFALSARGSTPDVDTSTDALITASALGIGATTAATSYMNGTIKRITYWPVRLADTTLQSITAP